MLRCPPVCMMAWRIGDRLDLGTQVEWIQEAGFDGVGFHAATGVPGSWQGLDPHRCDSAERRRWRRRLSAFRAVEVHAPFALTLAGGTPTPVLDALAPVLAFAGDLGSAVVTVHAEIPPLSVLPEAWRSALHRLDTLARQNGLRVGLEITSGFGAIGSLGLDRVGITLDVGHMLHHGGRALSPFGSLGELVRHIDPFTLNHLHVHDVRQGRDHLEFGDGGEVDLADLCRALRGIGYARALCLELNPDAVSPDGMARCLAAVRHAWASRTSEAAPGVDDHQPKPIAGAQHGR